MHGGIHPPPPVNRITDRCKNITFPGGNKYDQFKIETTKIPNAERIDTTVVDTDDALRINIKHGVIKGDASKSTSGIELEIVFYLQIDVVDVVYTCLKLEEIQV